MAKRARIDTPPQETRNFGDIFNRGGKDVKRNKKSIDEEFFRFFLKNRLDDVIRKQKNKKKKRGLK